MSSAKARTLDEAVAHHQSGDRERAESIYREIITRDPRQADALHLLGVAAHQSGHNEAAIGHITRAIAINPNASLYYSNLGAAYKAHGDLESAANCFREAVRISPDFSGAHYNLGMALKSQGLLAEAVDSFQQAVTCQSDYAEAHYSLGNAFAELSLHKQAIESFGRVLEINPRHAAAHNNLGTSLLQSGNLDEAITSFRRALSLDGNDANTHANLGHALRDKGENDEALTHFQHVLKLDPNHDKAQSSVGKILHSQGDVDAAIDSYRRALALAPDDAGVHYLLGNALKDRERFDEAIGSYRHAIELMPEYLQAHYDLGNALKRIGDLDQARTSYEAALRIQPDHLGALVCLGNVLKTQDHLDLAADCYRRALEKSPENAAWDLWIASLCPTVFPDTEAIDRYRQKFLSDLERVSTKEFKLSPEAVNSYACPPPYEIQFHGRDDRPLKEAYANVFRESFPVRTFAARGTRPRIGIVVTSGHEGVFVRCMKGILERLDSELGELVMFCSANGKERIQQRMDCESIEMSVVSHRFEQALETIREARCDVLYYWEVGSDVTNYFLPFFQPAAVQCTGWGVPVTTGIPTMDYFLSSKFVESEGADDDYTEQLLRADTLLTWQEPLAPPENLKDRTSFGFANQDHLYLCTQQIRKIHPDFDRLIEQILQRDPRGRVVLAKDRHGYAAKKLQARFATTIPDVVDRIVFLPHQSMPDYLSLVIASDVILDTPHFGGGLTIYDAFSFHKPVVTLPSRFRRSRYAFGCYQLMGMTDCVAATTDEYVDIAVALGGSPDYRNAVSSRIEEGSARLFENPAAVREYERIFRSLLEEAGRRCDEIT